MHPMKVPSSVAGEAPNISVESIRTSGKPFLNSGGCFRPCLEQEFPAVKLGGGTPILFSGSCSVIGSSPSIEIAKSFYHYRVGSN